MRPVPNLVNLRDETSLQFNELETISPLLIWPIPRKSVAFGLAETFGMSCVVEPDTAVFPDMKQRRSILVSKWGADRHSGLSVQSSCQSRGTFVAMPSGAATAACQSIL